MADCGLSVEEIEINLKKLLLSPHSDKPSNNTEGASKRQQRRKAKNDKNPHKTALSPVKKKGPVKDDEEEAAETEVKTKKKRRPNKKERLRLRQEQEVSEILSPIAGQPTNSPLTESPSVAPDGNQEPFTNKVPLLPTPPGPQLKKGCKPSRSSDGQGQREISSDLEKDYLFPLKKKSIKFPSAKFFCRLCEYHCDDVGHCWRHMQDTRHTRLKKMKTTEILLKSLPPPCSAHCSVVEKILHSVLYVHTLSAEQSAQRLSAFEFVVKTLKEDIPEADLVLYGSTDMGVALIDSDMNIDITMQNSPRVLLKIFDFMRTDDSGAFTLVRSNFSSTVPSVLFQLPLYGNLNCQIAVNNSPSCKTSKLLNTYLSLDPRVAQLCKVFRCWAHLCQIDSQDNGTLPAYAYSLMTVYFLQQCNPPVIPVLHEMVEVNPKVPGHEHEYLSDPNKIKHMWTCRNTATLSELWIQLLRFYCVDYDMGNLVISIRQKKPLHRSEKKWASKKIALEDPFIRKRNIARTLSHSQVFEYIVDRLRSTYLYYGIPQTKNGPLFGDVDSQKLERQLQISMRSKGEDSVPSLIKSASPAESDTVQSGVDSVSPLTPDCVTSECSSNFENFFDVHLLENLEEEDMQFLFNAKEVVDLKGPAVFCSLCQRPGHLKKSCPDENLPPIQPVPPMTPEFKSKIDNVLWKVPRDFEPSEKEIRMRKDVLSEMQQYIRETFPDANLSLFGSSCNGFGFQHSDLDICLVFNGVPLKEAHALNCVDIIEKIAFILKRHRDFYNVFAITTAKVPIVKFKHRRSNLEGDISLYNTLAQHNTRLLQTYADIDPRVRVLGYTMKVFAKCCDICDASRGSLSSYAYILLVIYYLQQCNPPVLPVLQEMYEGGKKPEVPVDGWNTWFFSDVKNIRHKGFGKLNTSSVSELWNGLLKFYTEEFNIRDYVICIRQKERLTKFEKLWNNKCISIEDPFDLDHNLGSGLSRKMNVYIIKAFRNARQLYGTPFEHYPPRYRSMEDYLFDVEVLTDGAPPNDRGCRMCGRIGHFMRECPVFLAKKEGSNNSKGKERRSESSLDENGSDTTPSDTFPVKSKHKPRGPGEARRFEQHGKKPNGRGKDKSIVKKFFEDELSSARNLGDVALQGKQSRQKKRQSMVSRFYEDD